MTLNLVKRSRLLPLMPLNDIHPRWSSKLSPVGIGGIELVEEKTYNSLDSRVVTHRSAKAEWTGYPPQFSAIYDRM